MVLALVATAKATTLHPNFTNQYKYLTVEFGPIASDCHASRDPGTISW
jgi:hypothetical protein